MPPIRRETSPSTCAMCPTVFFAWRRPRKHPACCSIQCARKQQSAWQKGRPLTAALQKIRETADGESPAALARRFGVRLTPREIAIYRYGLRNGYHRGRGCVVRDTQRNA